MLEHWWALPGFILLLLIIGTAAIAGVYGAPWVPTHGKDMHRMLAMANIQAGERVVDLGCGDGRLLVTAAHDFHAQAFGCELSMLPYLAAQIRKALSKNRKDIHVTLGDLYRYPLHDADVVFCFLMPKTLGKLKDKFVRELKPGARIVTNCFQIPGWQPEREERPTPSSMIGRVYRVPSQSV